MIATRKATFLLSMPFLCLIFLLAQTPDESVLTLDQCITIAVQQNPLVLSSIQQYNASLARVNQAKALDPDMGRHMGFIRELNAYCPMNADTLEKRRISSMVQRAARFVKDIIAVYALDGP